MSVAAHETAEKLPSDENQTDTPDVDESLRLQALIMFLNGQTQKQISAHFHRDERTIRRWIKKAREDGLVRLDNLKPWDALSEILLKIDQNRIELLELKQAAQEAGDGALVLRCIHNLNAMEEKRFRILDRIGLFKGYSPYNPPLNLSMSDVEDRTKVYDDDEVEYEYDDDYEEQEYESEDDDDDDIA